MTVARCSWCGKPAISTVTAKGLERPLYDCDSDECWERSYRAVRDKVPRTWKLIGRPTGRKAAPQPGPDLFDHLPER